MPALLDRLSAPRERALLTALVLLGYALYLPVGRLSFGLTPRSPELGLDHATPLVPGLVFVYGLLYSIVGLPLVLPAGRHLFRRVALAYGLVQLISLTTFLAWPVHMNLRPEALEATSFASWTLRFIYWIDRPSNCFPSLHVSCAMLAALCTLKVDRRIGGGAVLLAIVISASTMFVKQHWFADVVSGAALALLAWWLLVRPVSTAPGQLGYKRLLPLALFQLAIYGVLWGLYAADWEPWVRGAAGM